MIRRLRKKISFRLKLAILLSLVFIVLLISLFSLLNNKSVQSLIFKSFNNVSDLKIESAHLKIGILSRKVHVKDLFLKNDKKKQEFKSSDVSFRFRILPLITGNLKIFDLSAKDLDLVFGKPDDETKKRKKTKLSLNKLLLLKNISIKNGIIKNLKADTPAGLITSDKVEINYIPSIWGKIKLYITIKSPIYWPNKTDMITVEKIHIKGTTDVGEWIDQFPYVNNIEGKINLDNIKWKDLFIGDITTKLSYSDLKLRLNYLTADFEGSKLELSGKINGKKETYTLRLNIPEPIFLPHLARETAFLKTSGGISGEVRVKGKGLDYKTTTGSAIVDLVHQLEGKDALPTKLKTKIDIGNGKLKLVNGALNIFNSNVSVSGSFDYLNPNINLSFEGNEIPVEPVLSRFQSKYYHPTKGMASAKGTVSGWKHNIKFNLHVEAKNPSYYDIVVERLSMDLDITYNKLKLIGHLYQNNSETGKVLLDMTMGEKMENGTRRKKFDLTATLNNADLDSSFAEYDLRGTGNGTLKLSGSPTAYSGQGSAEITNGSFKEIGFTRASTDSVWKTRKVTFNNIKITTSETNPATFPNPLFMDMVDSGVRFHGSPRDGIDIDANYITSNSSWKIAKLSYSSEEHPEWESKLTGTMNANGALNLRATGTLDAKLLGYLKGMVRTASGPIELKNIHIGGTTENPSLNGSIHFYDNILQLRALGYYVDKIKGDISFSGHTIKLPNFTGRIEYGEFALSGTAKHQNMEISNCDLSFTGKSILYATPDRKFRMEFDSDIKIKGGPNSSTITGSIDILDGKYTKNFSIFDAMKGKPEYSLESASDESWKNMKLNLKVRSIGELKIDNNIGEIWLNIDLGISGTQQKPKYAGNIDTVGGEIHYAGLEFEVLRGFLEFHDPYKIPFVEFVGSKEVGQYNVILTVRGRVDKLYVDLESTPPLDKQNIMALLTFGVTSEDLENARFGYSMGAGFAAEQVASLMARPITKFTPLDTFRIETNPMGAERDVTRLNMGAKVSDRLRFNFYTDVGSAEALQIFEVEYLMTDFLLLKGSRTTDSRYRFHFTLRFSEQ